MNEFRFEVWPTESRVITQQFGVNSAYYGRFGLPGHDGVDIRARAGSAIYAVADGRIVQVNRDPAASNYGLYVRVAHRDGYITTYGHLSQILVTLNSDVAAGDTLGLAGETGNSAGPHLHLSLKRKDAADDGWPYDLIDPTPFLLPLLGWRAPAGELVDGWMLRDSLYRNADLAQVHIDGAQFWRAPDEHYTLAGGTIVVYPGIERRQYAQVRVARVALGTPPDDALPPPDALPEPLMATVDGWGWTVNLVISGRQAVVSARGINLRTEPTRTSHNVGLVRPGSTVQLLDEVVENDYRRVRAKIADIVPPVALPVLPPRPDQLPPPTPDRPDLPIPEELQHPQPRQPVFLGWVRSALLDVGGAYAHINFRYGASLYAAPQPRAARLAIIKGAATVALAGAVDGRYTPVLVRAADLVDLATPLPAVTMPSPLPAALDPALPAPAADTTPGWLLTADIQGRVRPRVRLFGAHLRAGPQRDAEILGFAHPRAMLLVLGAPVGEYTPVRVDDDALTWTHPVLQPPPRAQADLPPLPAPPEPVAPPPVAPPVAPPAPSPPVRPAPPPPQPPQPPQPVRPVQPPPDPIPAGSARIGLHASADPMIGDAELAAFAQLRPGMIKLLSFHDPDQVKRLAQQHPHVDWVIRAFLSFNRDPVTPAQFVERTLSDVRRTIAQIGAGKPIAIELHNEPNLVAEGLTTSWRDGATFADWWLELRRLYRAALPDVPLLFPGLSPGYSVANLRLDHIAFLEACRPAVEAADGLAVHLYWSRYEPMQRALALLDDTLARFRHKPIWISEASNNDRAVPADQKAYEYIQFWQQLQRRAGVRGVTYFVASASNPAFTHEVWVGRDIARIVGLR